MRHIVWSFSLLSALAQTLAPTFNLECRFRGEPKPAQVTIDGVDLGQCPLEVRTSPGRHLLRLRLAEKEGRFLAYEARLEIVEEGAPSFVAELVWYDPRVEALPGASGLSGLIYALAYSPSKPPRLEWPIEFLYRVQQEGVKPLCRLDFGWPGPGLPQGPFSTGLGPQTQWGIRAWPLCARLPQLQG